MSSANQRTAGTAAATLANQQFYAAEDLLSLGDMLGLVWRRRWIVLIAAFAAAGAGCALSFVIHKKYDASVIVSPVADESGAGRLGGLSSLVSQIGGGVAGLAGLSMGGNEHKAESLAILQSEALSERFIKEKDLLPVLFARLWDPVNRKWKTTDPDVLPTPWKAYQRFKEIRHISTDVKTGLTTLTITWRDPQVAADWANSLVTMCNDTIRVRTVTEAERNIAYLNEQLTKANIVAVQNSISALLESEIKKVMMARGSEEYAFRVLDPAVPPEKPAFPSPPLWTALGFIAGALVAAVVVLIRSIYVRDRPVADASRVLSQAFAPPASN